MSGKNSHFSVLCAAGAGPGAGAAVAFRGALWHNRKQLTEVTVMEREDYMRLALAEAERALETGDVPVGCVVTDVAGNVIGRGRNRREERQNAVRHAEIEAIEAACAAVGSWRLDGCAIYVTLEPCPMCAGAILNARIPTLVYGAKEPATGSCGSVLNLFEERYGFRPAIYGGVLAAECAGLLRDFFGGLRRNGPE